MEVTWSVTFAEGTSIDAIRTFFSSADFSSSSLKCDITGQIWKSSPGPSKAGKYAFLVAKVVTPGSPTKTPAPSWSESAVIPENENHEEKVWVHTQSECHFSHWHGHKVPVEKCLHCNSTADPPCGGGSFRSKRQPSPRGLKKQFARLTWRGLIHSRIYHPFKGFDDNVTSEDATNVHYDVVTDSWQETPVKIKLEKEPFGRGAMREAFRMKMLELGDHTDWSHAPPYVAKRFLDPNEDQDKCSRDVRQQMLAKHYAQLYNAQDPPKMIDFIQAAYIKLIRRRPMVKLGVEIYVEGSFEKFNNNSGIIFEGGKTPQAFSHFTYERSNKQLIVVDIQGVGDLYTDPQIHSADGNQFGPGDLGISGMALFFSSHRCSALCKTLNLTPFDIYDPTTTLDDDSDDDVPPPVDRAVSVSALFRRCSLIGPALRRTTSAFTTTLYTRSSFPHFIEVNPATIPTKATVDSAVHFQLALYYKDGRFNDNKEPEIKPALYHLQRAAQHGSIPALLALAKLYSDSHCHRDVLPDSVNLEDKAKALQLLEAAADRGNPSATANVAQAYHKGYLGAKLDWVKAAKYYKEFINFKMEEKSTVPNCPSFGWEEHGIQVCTAQKDLADIFSKGGNGLQRNPNIAYQLYGEAAEALMDAMKAKLANQCYELQAELESELDENEDN